MAMAEGKRWTDDEIARLRAMYDGDALLTQMVDSLHRKDTTIMFRLSRILGRKVFEHTGRRWTATDMAGLARVFVGDVAVKTAVDAMGRSPAAMASKRRVRRGAR